MKNVNIYSLLLFASITRHNLATRNSHVHSRKRRPSISLDTQKYQVNANSYTGQSLLDIGSIIPRGGGPEHDQGKTDKNNNTSTTGSTNKNDKTHSTHPNKESQTSMESDEEENETLAPSTTKSTISTSTNKSSEQVGDSSSNGDDSLPSKPVVLDQQKQSVLESYVEEVSAWDQAVQEDKYQTSHDNNEGDSVLSHDIENVDVEEEFSIFNLGNQNGSDYDDGKEITNSDNDHLYPEYSETEEEHEMTEEGDLNDDDDEGNVSVNDHHHQQSRSQSKEDYSSTPSSTTTTNVNQSTVNRKKSNAVGDPDDDSDNDDSEDDTDHDHSDILDSIEFQDEDEDANNNPVSFNEMEVKIMEVYEATPPRGGASTKKEFGNSNNRKGNNRGDRRGALVKSSSLSLGKNRASSSDSTKSDDNGTTLDEALVSAFMPMLYLPPPELHTSLLEKLEQDAVKNDVSSRRRLDRRTLYQSLLLEFTGGVKVHTNNDSNGSKNNAGGATSPKKKSQISKRKFLEEDTKRSLKGALSLASQPRWRKHVVMGQTGGSSTVGNNDDLESVSSYSLPKRSTNSSGNRRRRRQINKNGDSYLEEEESLSSDDEGEELQTTSDSLPFWWRGGVRLYNTEEEEDSNSASGSSPFTSPKLASQNSIMGMWGRSSSSEDGEDGSIDQDDESGSGNSHSNAMDSSALPCTLGMQETVAMALAHSLNCGLALIDDVALSSVRQTVITEYPELELEEDSVELRNTNLMGHLIRLANEGKLPLVASSSYEDGDFRDDRRRMGGLISNRMERDIALGLDDPHDELAVESFKMMKKEEDGWFELTKRSHVSSESKLAAHNIELEDEDAHLGDKKESNRPLPLVLFLRTGSCTNLLKSKSAVDRLARECVNDESIHLLMLGKGIDATTVNLPSHQGDDGSSGIGSSTKTQLQSQGMQPRPSFIHPSQHQHVGGSPNNNPFLQNQGNNPFGSLSNVPPGASMNQQGQSGAGPQGPFGFSQQNINASGVNDPEGSRRFNIFLARTVDKDGTPGIMGAIAPPQAGNLFPQMLHLQAQENYLRSQQDGDSEEEQQKHEAAMQRWTDLMNQHNSMNKDVTHPPQSQYFNASIGSPFGGEGKSMDGNNNGFNGMMPPPPEVIQKAFEHAINDVMASLSDMENGKDGDDNSSMLPPHLAKAFGQILSNENLRRGIAENLARAAPALVDPRCQGVMLSVYVPPGPDHPNRGLMPGQQRKGKSQQPKNLKKQQGSVAGWLNKIISSSTNSNADTEEDTGSDIEDGESDLEEIIGQEVEEAPNGKQESPSLKDGPPKPSGKKLRRRDRQARMAAVAAATAIIEENKKSTKHLSENNGVLNSHTPSTEQKVQKHLTRLQALCRCIPLRKPADPVRSRSWESWALRERGAIIFRKNRRALNAELSDRLLRIKTDAGTKGIGSVLRQMLSVRDLSNDMEEVLKCAVETEAARSQRLKESPWDSNITKAAPSGPVDPSLDQLLLHIDNLTCVDQDLDDSLSKSRFGKRSKVNYIHPKSLETALSTICRISPSPSGASSSTSTSQTVHRTKEEISELAADKHERALVSQVVSPQDIGVSYDMIGGLGEVKELLRQSITYPLKFPHLYSEGIAREAVKGVLLFGPPGTGKTMLAKAVATEGGATFLSVDASCVENKWLGESEKNAKAVFTLARRLAPCVIFIDEVDSILSSREGSSDDSAHGTLTSVKTTMMSEWDGLNSGTNGKGEAGSDRVVVIGSTNRPFDLDEAVLRRFPRRILVDLPDIDTRREILEVTMAENRLDPSVNLTAIAERLEGYTGSDIKEVCREAVVQISHEHARRLDQGFEIDQNDDLSSSEDLTRSQRLRPVTIDDFDKAMGKLKRSVSEKGRELMRVWEWNDEYGEIKKNKKDHLPQLMNMFV